MSSNVLGLSKRSGQSHKLAALLLSEWLKLCCRLASYFDSRAISEQGQDEQDRQDLGINLDNMHFSALVNHVNPVHFFLLLGPNGAGKSLAQVGFFDSGIGGE